MQNYDREFYLDIYRYNYNYYFYDNYEVPELDPEKQLAIAIDDCDFSDEATHFYVFCELECRPGKTRLETLQLQWNRNRKLGIRRIKPQNLMDEFYSSYTKFLLIITSQTNFCIKFVGTKVMQISVFHCIAKQPPIWTQT